MASSRNKTVETANSVIEFISTIADSKKRDDSLRLLKIMGSETGHKPRLWGTNIIGFGSYHYRYKSGHEGDAPLVGFSPREKVFSIYLGYDFDKDPSLLVNFGKYKRGKSCLYFQRLADINETVLRKMISTSIKMTIDKHKKT